MSTLKLHVCFVCCMLTVSPKMGKGVVLGVEPINTILKGSLLHTGDG